MSWLAVYSAGVSSCTCTSQPLNTSTTGSKVSRTSLSIFPPSLLAPIAGGVRHRSEEHTSELQSRVELVCRLLLEKKKSVIPSLRQASTRGPTLAVALGRG